MNIIKEANMIQGWTIMMGGGREPWLERNIPQGPEEGTFQLWNEESRILNHGPGIGEEHSNMCSGTEAGKYFFFFFLAGSKKLRRPLWLQLCERSPELQAVSCIAGGFSTDWVTREATVGDGENYIEKIKLEGIWTFIGFQTLWEGIWLLMKVQWQMTEMFEVGKSSHTISVLQIP